MGQIGLEVSHYPQPQFGPLVPKPKFTQDSEEVNHYPTQSRPNCLIIYSLMPTNPSAQWVELEAQSKPCGSLYPTRSSITAPLIIITGKSSNHSKKKNTRFFSVRWEKVLIIYAL